MTKDRASEALMLQTPCSFRKLDARIMAQQLFQLIDSRGQEFIFMIDQFKGAVPFLILRGKNAKPLVTDFMIHQAQGHDRQNFIV